MTPEAQRIAIAEACGWLPDHINRHAMYYVPDKDCHVGDLVEVMQAAAAQRCNSVSQNHQQMEK